MTLLAKLARLDAAERWLLVQTAIVVPIVRIALTMLPFRFVHRAVAAVTPRARCASHAPEQITRMVAAVAARVPRATCLTQALAATVLLTRHGHPSTVRLGVAKNEDGSIRAHAWLESGGRTLLGGPESGEFTRFPPVALSRR